MKNKFKDLLLVVSGNVLLAFAVVAFIIPNATLSGGVSGVAVLVAPFSSLPTDRIVTIISVVLYIVGAVLLGKKFALATMVSAIVYPLAVEIMAVTISPIYVDDLLSAIYAGVLMGAGVGLAVSTGASTGGMDIPPLLMKKYFNIDVSTGVVIVDGLTVLCGVFIYGIEKVLIGLICTYISGVVIDKIMMMRLAKSKQVEIISDRYEEISEAINLKLDRGTTLMEGRGGYTGERRPVVMTVVPDREYPRLQALIDSFDREAFVIISDVKEVRGEGFTFEPKYYREK